MAKAARFEAALKKIKNDATTIKLFCDRVENGCSEIEDASVDFALFSPPYFKRDKYTRALMLAVGRVLKRVLKPGARAQMVFGQVSEDFGRPKEAWKLVLEGGADDDAAAAIRSDQDLVWVKSFFHDGKHKGHFTPINSPDISNYGFEYVFGFIKGKKPAHPLNRLGIGVPYADKGNLKRGTRGKNGDVHCMGDAWWYITYDTVQDSDEKGHRHGFPLELARRAIVRSGIPKKSLVLDFFMGGGTTAEASRLCGMHVVGCDQDAAQVKKALARWEARAGQRIPLDAGAL